MGGAGPVINAEQPRAGSRERLQRVGYRRSPRVVARRVIDCIADHPLQLIPDAQRATSHRPVLPADRLGTASLAYCTRDKHLAAPWSSLRYAVERWRGNDVEIDLRPGGNLFPRLSADEIDALFDRLRG